MVLFQAESLGLLIGAVVLGAVHGIEPGHGWPVAASYALDQTNKWVSGFAASLLIGVGHLVSSLAMVGVFFYAKSYFSLTQVNEPITVAGGVQIGGPVSLVAGVLLIALGVREYRHGHSHGDGEHEHGSHGHTGTVHKFDGGHAHDHATVTLDKAPVHAQHDHGAHDHPHAHHGDDHADGGLLARLAGLLPFVGGHSHAHGSLDDAADRGLFGIAWFAFVLGFAHEEEFEIIAMCAGSTMCLELMSVYALTVILGIVVLTLALIAGYQHFEAEVEKYTPYLPVFSAAVLVLMGIGFITGLF